MSEIEHGAKLVHGSELEKYEDNGNRVFVLGMPRRNNSERRKKIAIAIGGVIVLAFVVLQSIH